MNAKVQPKLKKFFNTRIILARMSGQAAQTVTGPMTRWRRNIRLIRNKKP